MSLRKNNDTFSGGSTRGKSRNTGFSSMSGGGGTNISGDTRLH